MLCGEVVSQENEGYRLLLANGQSLHLEARYLPEPLQKIGQKFNLVFGGVEASGIEPGEARALLNSLLTLG